MFFNPHPKRFLTRLQAAADEPDSLYGYAAESVERTEAHPGFDLLLYHGYSLIYYAKEVQPIKDAGGKAFAAGST